MSKLHPEVILLSGLGIIGLVCHNRECNAPHLQEVLTSHGERILGRMGVRSPGKEQGIICLIVEGTEDEIQATAEDIGHVDGVTTSHMMIRG